MPTPLRVLVGALGPGVLPTAATGLADWSALGEAEGKRLRELGFDEGVSVETLHSGSIFGRDPIACRVGRMTVAIRRVQASAIRVALNP